MINIFQLALFQPPVVDNDWRYKAPRVIGLSNDEGDAIWINRSSHSVDRAGPGGWYCGRSFRIRLLGCKLRTLWPHGAGRERGGGREAGSPSVGCPYPAENKRNNGFMFPALDQSVIIWSHYDLTDLVMSNFHLTRGLAVSGFYAGRWSVMNSPGFLVDGSINSCAKLRGGCSETW